MKTGWEVRREINYYESRLDALLLKEFETHEGENANEGWHFF